MTDKVVLLTSCGSREEALRLARLLVEAKLAACVTLLPGATSIYQWQDAVEEAEEVVLLIKSRRDLAGPLREAIASLHSYEVPELIVLPVVDGAPEYFDWLERSLLPPKLPEVNS